jgi:hypothetical protein
MGGFLAALWSLLSCLPTLADVTVLESRDAGADAQSAFKSQLTSPPFLLAIGGLVVLILVLLVVKSGKKKSDSPPPSAGAK